MKDFLKGMACRGVQVWQAPGRAAGYQGPDSGKI